MGVDTETVVEMFRDWRVIRELTRSWPLERDRLMPFVSALGHMLASEVTPVVWAEFRSKRRTAKGKRLSATTLDLELIRVKQMYKWATKEGRLSRNPLADAQGSGEKVERETWLTWEQVEALLKSCPNPFVAAWILVAVGTGMRLGETLSLRHDRIGGDGTVTLNAVQTKSKKRRIVALPPRAFDAVSALPRHWSSPFVFWSQRTAKAVGRSTMRRWFRQAAKVSGLDAFTAEGDLRLRCHDMRHTFASLADAAGASLRALQLQLGHAEPRTTQRYMHREDNDRALEIAALMDRRPAKRAPMVPDERKAILDRKFS